MKKGLFMLFILGMVVLFIESCSTSGVNLEKRELSALNTVSGDKLLKYVKILASDNLAGRLTGTIEYKQSALWVAEKMKSLELATAGGHDSYLQAYPNPYTVVFVGGGVWRRISRGRTHRYRYEKDYFPGSCSSNGKITAEVVYVGFGIMAPELDYDDYKGINVRGKIVLAEPGVPVLSEEDPGKLKEWSPYASLRYKMKMAKVHGARGFLLNELAVLPDTEHISGLIVSNVGQNVTDDIFSAVGKSHVEVLKRIKKNLNPMSFRTRQVFTLQNMTEFHSRGKGYNVIGFIPGSDPLLKEDVIIIGANLDHKGFCYEVMPGANDNASGIAVLLGAAEALSKSVEKPRRSILFLALGSHEQGFLGAQTYMKHPAFPLKNTKAFIGIERIGRDTGFQVLGAVDFPGFYDVLLKAQKTGGSFLLEKNRFNESILPDSDAQYFYKKHIPSLLIRGKEKHEQISGREDTPDKIDPQILLKWVRILYFAVKDLDARNKLDFKKSVSKASKR